MSKIRIHCHSQGFIQQAWKYRIQILKFSSVKKTNTQCCREQSKLWCSSGKASLRGRIGRPDASQQRNWAVPLQSPGQETDATGRRFEANLSQGDARDACKCSHGEQLEMRRAWAGQAGESPSSGWIVLIDFGSVLAICLATLHQVADCV